MNFQFNFAFQDKIGDTDDACENDAVSAASSSFKDLHTAKEIHPKPFTEDILKSEYEVVDICKAVSIKCLRSKSVEEELSLVEGDNCIKKIVKKHSDLIPKIYEGGLKIWECSLDLVEHLNEAKVQLEKLSVLELGCGAGLPGIYALQQGANHVCFQDFNEEVITHFTIPNVSLNVDHNVISDRCCFLSGDWNQTGSDLIPPERYDVILTAETIYSTESVPSLYQLMKRSLKPDGNIYVAAKTHYFGVGGGTRLFEQYVQNQEDFTIATCKKITDGVQREILHLKRKVKDTNK